LRPVQKKALPGAEASTRVRVASSGQSEGTFETVRPLSVLREVRRTSPTAVVLIGWAETIGRAETRGAEK
jgi:hypothetical protein